MGCNFMLERHVYHMKIVVAPDKWKGSLSAEDVCRRTISGLRSVLGEEVTIVSIPLADGGEGSLEVLSRYTEGRLRTVLVKDPLGRSIEASYLLAEDKAYVELAAASGLQLLAHDERNPLYTSSYGTGELILDAISHGVKDVYVMIGGSATNDMGIGIAEALGYRFLDKDGDEVPPIGISLGFITRIQKFLRYDPLKVRFHVICDVDNVLYGKSGAVQMHAKQKGADKYARSILDKGMRKLSRRCAYYLEKGVADLPGAGAAGGIGGGMKAFHDASLLPGSEFILSLAKFDDAIADASWVITGEGQIDGQTLHGKLVHEVINRSQRRGCKTAIFAGRAILSDEDKEKLQVDHMVDLVGQGIPLSESIRDAGAYLEQAVKSWATSIA